MNLEQRIERLEELVEIESSQGESERDFSLLRRTVGSLRWLDSLPNDEYAELWLTILPIALLSAHFRYDGEGTPWVDRAMAVTRKELCHRGLEWPRQ